MKLGFKHKLIAAFFSMGLLIFFASTLVFYFSFKRIIYEHLERELTEEAAEFDRMIEFRGDSLIVDLEREWNEFEHTSSSKSAVYVAIVDSRFRTIKKSRNLGQQELQSSMPLEPTTEIQTLRLSINAQKSLGIVFPVRKAGTGVGYILIVTSLENADEYVEMWKGTIWISLFIMVVVGAGVAYFLANQLIKPVESIKHEARKISLQNLDKRIPLQKGDSELESLVDTLNDLFERLERSFKQIDEFTSNVSHELRTPLTILRGNIEVALTRDRTKKEYVEILSGLLEETISLSNMVENLLLLARADSTELVIDRKPVVLKSFLAENAQMLESLCALKHQPLQIRVHDEVVIQGDEKLLSQLFLNLISNACKFSPEGQPIEILAERKQPSSGRPETVHIQVKDAGMGIPRTEQEKVFQRFYRLEKDRSRETGGTGLGLPICRMIMQLHQGSISIAGQPGVGTTVNLWFPADEILDAGGQDSEEALKDRYVVSH